MNFDSFLKRYGIEEYTSAIVMERETLLHMLTDLYNEGYNDGAVKEYGSIVNREQMRILRKQGYKIS